MAEKQKQYEKEILQHSEVWEVIRPDSDVLRVRRGSIPEVCSVFKTPVTGLKKDCRYRFEIDREARKQLPGIINAVHRPDRRGLATSQPEHDKCQQQVWHEQAQLLTAGSPAAFMAG